MCVRTRSCGTAALCAAALFGLSSGVSLGVDKPTLIPYEGCGQLLPGIECPRFQGFDGASFSMVNTGGFQLGDVIHIAGDICLDCVSICQDGPIFLQQDIGPCKTYIDECGTLAYQGNLPFFCIVFQSDSGFTYAIDNLGSFDIGDSVRVTGLLGGACPPADCGPIDGCISGNTITGCMLGDVNGDGHVNLTDLLAVINVWGGACNDGCAEDLNGDQFINAADLLIVLNHWG